MLADLTTPVSLYLRFRDVFPNALLLESSDYHAVENSYSFICLKALASFKVSEGRVSISWPDGTECITEVTAGRPFTTQFSEFLDAFREEGNSRAVSANGLFGYCSYDAVRYFEKIQFNAPVRKEHKIPDIFYAFYQYVIAINHAQNNLHIIENVVDGHESGKERIADLLTSRKIATYSFRTNGTERSNISDEQYKELVTRAKEHCHRGDVFQMVMSRQFSQCFSGDEFNVYRALRSINPSPYLFFFDYGNFRIFGSSPEAHLKIQKGKAYINPIAGTFRRTGDDEHDKRLARQLAADLKENAEHVMLVDLARNDLSRYARNVKVESFREVQFYSHVIHLVSSVSGELKEGATLTDLMASTFPAGTLTGAPKYRAMQLIDRYENQNRGYYGGAIGFLDFSGRFNHAIMIRTFLSKDNVLYYQAGAGIVAISEEEKELQEVNSKLGALKKAIEMAGEICRPSGSRNNTNEIKTNFK